LHRKGLLKHFIEGGRRGNTEVTGRRGRRGRQLLGKIKKRNEDTLLKEGEEGIQK